MTRKTSTLTASHDTASDRSIRPLSKLDTIEALLLTPGGATIADLIAATGWQPHSVRGALAGALRKRGHAIISTKADGVRRYRIATPQ
jgi:hypothetical protein